MAQLVKNHLQSGRPGFDPWVGKIPWKRKGYPLQYSGLEKPMDCIVHGVTKSQTLLSVQVIIWFLVDKTGQYMMKLSYKLNHLPFLLERITESQTVVSQMGIQQTFLQQWIKWACHFKENSSQYLWQSDPKVLLPTVPFLIFILHVIPSPWMWTCDVTCFWPTDYKKGYGITIPVILSCVWLTSR